MNKQNDDSETNSIQPSERGERGEVLAMLGRALTDPNVSVEKMERMFSLQERWENRKAAQQAHQAMIAVRAKLPEIVKDAQGQNSKYAKLEKIDRIAYPVYTAEGFSLQWSEVPHETPGWTRLKCVVLHSGGHREEHFISGPMDDKGPKGLPNKTGVQGMGSTWSYLQRRLLAMIFNLRIVGEDNDGQGRIQQHGPSSKPTGMGQNGPENAQADAGISSGGVDQLKAAKGKLWVTLKEVRGDVNNWATAEAWMQFHKILTAGQTVSSLTADQMTVAVEKSEIVLAQ